MNVLLPIDFIFGYFRFHLCIVGVSWLSWRIYYASKFAIRVIQFSFSTFTVNWAKGRQNEKWLSFATAAPSASANQSPKSLKCIGSVVRCYKRTHKKNAKIFLFSLIFIFFFFFRAAKPYRKAVIILNSINNLTFTNSRAAFWCPSSRHQFA